MMLRESDKLLHFYFSLALFPVVPNTCIVRTKLSLSASHCQCWIQLWFGCQIQSWIRQINVGLEVGFAVGWDIGSDVGFDVGLELGIDVGLAVSCDEGVDV